MNDLLTLDKMLTPKFITVIYWLSLVVWFLSGLFTIFAAGSLLYGILIIIFGAVGSRIYCELMIVMFRMNEALQDIRQKQ